MAMMGSTGTPVQSGNYNNCKGNPVYIDRKTQRILVLTGIAYNPRIGDEVYAFTDAVTGAGSTYTKEALEDYLDRFGTVASVFKALNSKLQESK